MKIGVITDCFKCPLEDAVKKARNLGLTGVQIHIKKGKFDTSMLQDPEKLKSYIKFFKDSQISISALCGDMGGHGFEIRKDNPERVEKTKRVIDLAQEFDCHVLTTHIGVIPADEKAEKFQALLEAIDTLGIYGKDHGVTLAIETGPETPEILKKFIDHTHGGVGVNLDPANLVMVTDADPARAVDILGEHIVHTHVKDGILKKKTDPGVIYNIFADGGIEDFRMSDYFIETPVGDGSVDFDSYLAALKKSGYDGYFTIEREAGPDPEKDIAKAAEYIRQKLQKAGY